LGGPATVGDALAVRIWAAVITRTSDATILISHEARPVPTYAHAIDPSLTLAHAAEVYNHWVAP